MNGRYKLVGHEAVPVEDLLEWAKDFENFGKRRVAATEVWPFMVSTVFLGLDHNWGDGPPLLFETMVFFRGDSRDLECERCSTWEEAEEQHRRVVKMASNPVYWTVALFQVSTQKLHDLKRRMKEWLNNQLKRG